jgi:hypothetical protein
MSWGWMHHKACRFIEYEKRFIFMKDVKGNGFRFYIKGLWAGDHQQNSVTGFDLVTGLHHLFVNGDMPVFN